jgi:Mg2+ and Co2+ transporter CorA
MRRNEFNPQRNDGKVFAAITILGVIAIVLNFIAAMSYGH